MYTVQTLILWTPDVTFIGDSQCSYSLLHEHVTRTFEHHDNSFDDWPILAQGMQKHSKRVHEQSVIWYSKWFADSGSVLVVISNV